MTNLLVFVHILRTPGVVFRLVLTGLVVESVGIETATEEHEVDDREVDHRLDDWDTSWWKDGIVATDDLDVFFLTGLPVGGRLGLRDRCRWMERDLAVDGLAGRNATL